MTKTQIEKTLRKCQKRLRIQNWDIDLQVVGPSGFPDSRVAECRYFTRNMSATVRVLDPKFNHDDAPGMQHMESTLYHELLHPILTPLFDEEGNLDLQEQAIERIAKALAGI